MTRENSRAQAVAQELSKASDDLAGYVSFLVFCLTRAIAELNGHDPSEITADDRMDAAAITLEEFLRDDEEGEE